MSKKRETGNFLCEGNRFLRPEEVASDAELCLEKLERCEREAHLEDSESRRRKRKSQRRKWTTPSNLLGVIRRRGRSSCCADERAVVPFIRASPSCSRPTLSALLYGHPELAKRFRITQSRQRASLPALLWLRRRPRPRRWRDHEDSCEYPSF